MATYEDQNRLYYPESTTKQLALEVCVTADLRKGVHTRAAYLSLGPRGSEDGVRPEEHQELAVLLTQVEGLPQELQRLDPRPHRAGVVSTEWPQPLQQILG